LQADKLLIKGLKELGLEPSAGQVSAFMQYLDELKRWSRAINLTSIKTDEDIVVKHFIDSCLYLSALPDDVGSIADVGSGAGFPGVPLKIMRPALGVHLIESAGKKCSFLRHMTRALKLDGVEVVEARAEAVKDIEVDAAVTRATFSVRDFITTAEHIVKMGGMFILSKGPRAEDELKGAAFEYEIIKMKLPTTDIERSLIRVKRV